MADRIYLGGMTDTVLHCEADGSVVVEERQDAQSLLDQNARKRNERFAGGSGDFQETFDIPMVLMIRWQQECRQPMFSAEHMAYVDEKLRMPEFCYLTVAPKLRDPHILIKGSR